MFSHSVVERVTHLVTNLDMTQMITPVFLCLTQMTGEMSALRNKRIELLKGMQGTDMS